jgi:hypothetical protein
VDSQLGAELAGMVPGRDGAKNLRTRKPR